MTTARDVVASFREEKARERAEWHRNHISTGTEWERVQLWKERELTPKLRLATRAQYEVWLEGYINAGGNPTHSYDHPFSGLAIKIAVADFHLQPLYGAASESIIVPVGVSFTSEGLGHCSLYFMDGFSWLGGWIPISDDLLTSDR